MKIDTFGVGDPVVYKSQALSYTGQVVAVYRNYIEVRFFGVEEDKIIWSRIQSRIQFSLSRVTRI